MWVRQVQDDTGNPWGASRLSSPNAGVFFTTKIPVVDAALTVQASVAVVCSPRQGRSLPELLKAADRVMTRLKDQAPGRHAFHEDLFQSSLA